MKKAWILAVAILGAFTILLVSLAAKRVTHAFAERNAVAATEQPTVKAAPESTDASDDDSSVIRFVRNPEHMAPFAVNDLNGSALKSTSDLHGKVLLIAFWATWCEPCREEISVLNTLEGRYKGRLEIIGVSEDDDPPASVEKFAKKEGISYPVMMATKEVTNQFGDVPALPTTYLVDADGGVVQKHTGLYSAGTYDREIRALLKMPVDAKIETFDDLGQVFLKNAARATELPGVDLTGLTPEQKKLALKRMNSENCNCGCNLTIAQCRINDSTCETSKKLAANIVDDVKRNAAVAGSKP